MQVAGTKKWTVSGTKTPPGALFRVLRFLLSADVVKQRDHHKYNSQTQDCIALPAQPSQKSLSYLHIPNSIFTLFFFFFLTQKFTGCSLYKERGKKQGAERCGRSSSQPLETMKNQGLFGLKRFKAAVTVVLRGLCFGCHHDGKIGVLGCEHKLTLGLLRISLCASFQMQSSLRWNSGIGGMLYSARQTNKI